MQAYVKFKESDEELYEINMPIFKEGKQNVLIKVEKIFLQIFFSIVVKIKKIFHIITIKQIYTGYIFILPIARFKDNDLRKQQNFEKYLKKCIPKVKKLMKQYNVSTIILSEELKNNQIFIQKFQDNRDVKRQVKILDGTGLMPYLIQEIIEYISQKHGQRAELEDIYILISQDKIGYKENIAFLTQHFKTINIVTPCLSSYQKLADQLEEKYNAMITVTNNKKKSLRKAKWIVNFDMSTEEMKKYTVYRTSTIIYLNKNDIYEENTFEGLHICNAGIDVSQEVKDFFTKQYLINQCPITILYESTINQKSNMRLIKEQMRKDQVKINRLYGRRGALSEAEFLTK